MLMPPMPTPQIMTPQIMTPPLLQIRGLAKRFTLHEQEGAEITALSDIDLDLGSGECVVLAGPSGAGKSSLLRCVYGNYRVEEGEILLRENGQAIDIATAPDRALIALRRTSIGYVSQFLRVVPRISTLDIVAEPAIAAGLTQEEARQRAGTLLDRLALPERLWRLPPMTFSGGEQQRVNLARGLVVDYPLLLLDEPTASLDPENRGRVAALLESALARGAALLGIFHDQDFARAFATRFFPMTAPRRRAA
jgi:alpha-D-ribose 1-methylphosphonate 5-triphosphate synthase subunit PhnL